MKLAACLTVATFLAAAPTTHAAVIVASDNAADPAYPAPSWPDGSNGGYGFGPWNLSVGTNTGAYIGDSTQNGNGSLGINTSGKSWGVGAQQGGFVIAKRSFTPLAVGDTLSVDLDNGWIQNGGEVGIALYDKTVQGDQFNFSFKGGDSGYQYKDPDHSGGAPTGINFTADGLHVDFTLTGVVGTGYSYSAVVTTLNNNVATIITGNTGSLVNQIGFYDYNSGGGVTYDAYLNNLSISSSAVPEPATLGTLGIAGLSLLARRRRAR